MKRYENLVEGTYILLTGMEVKNDNDIFIVDSDYRINGKYAICKDERCLKKVKLNGELKTSGYNIVFLSDREIAKNPNMSIKIVTDLKAAKKELNNWLKGVNDNEIIVTFERSENQELKDNSIIRFTEGLKIGTFGEKYIPKNSLWNVTLRDNGTIFIQELGKKGQNISTGNSYGCTLGLTNEVIKVSEVVEKIETKKGDLNKESEIIETEEIKEEVNQESIVNEVEEIAATTENTNNTTTSENINTSVKVVFNEEKSGIELHFTDKPDQEILNSIKTNGFRWSKYQKIWYAKDSAEKRDFLKSIGLLSDNSENNETIDLKEVVKTEYPEININDIETYVIDEKLSKAENSVSMFRREDKNHTKEIQATLKSMNDDVITLIESSCNDYITYKAKEYLQRAKKKYYDNYVKMLHHKANNPSWAVTGRGNLNVSRYNKKMDQYNKMIQESSQIINDFNNKIDYFKNQVKKESQQKFETELKTAIENIDNNQTFEKIKVDINAGAAMNIFNINPDNGRMINVTAHKLNDYYIIKNWGYWRIYNKQGNEIEVIKRTIKTLDEAKKLCLYIVMEESKSKSAAV